MLNCKANNHSEARPRTTVAWAKQQFDAMCQDDNGCSIAVVLSRTNEYIGHISIADLNTQPRLSFIFDRDVWGQGLASEALKAFLPRAVVQLGLQSVTASVRQGQNSASHLLTKLGFAQTGLCQDAQGTYQEYQYSPA